MTIEQLEAPVIELPEIELITEDGEPLESGWHRSEINLLIETYRYHMGDRTDYYVGGNMFIYYSLEQARRLDYRGPDFFVVLDVDGSYSRDAWVVWKEGGCYPNVIIELLSPSTEKQDLTTKKDLYERVFRTPEYFCYSKYTHAFFGWNLVDGKYESIQPNEKGWLWSEQLQLWIGTWEGTYLGEKDTWLRFYDKEGNFVLTPAEAEQQRAEAELAKLKAKLQALGIETGDNQEG